FFIFFSSRRRHTRFSRDWSSDVCSSDLLFLPPRRSHWPVCLADLADRPLADRVGGFSLDALVRAPGKNSRLKSLLQPILQSPSATRRHGPLNPWPSSSSKRHSRAVHRPLAFP